LLNAIKNITLSSSRNVRKDKKQCSGGSMNLNKPNWEIAAGTETGYVRKENQDRMSWTQVPWGQLYIVADGIGGHAGGARAAELTVQGLERYLAKASEEIGIEDVIRDAFCKTNKDVFDKAHTGDPETEGMGSTAVILLISGQIAKVAHVGDSRAYLYRDGKLRLLTKDHTQVQRFVDAGMMRPEKARNHPSASLLERAIGHRPTVAMDIGADLVVKEGDGILLCSDGLSGCADDREIEAAINDSSSPQETVNRLLNLALKNGGEDNVTVQFVRYGNRTEARRSDYNGNLKSIISAILIASFAGGASVLTYMLVKNTAEENVSSLRTTINQLDSVLIQQISKIKELDEQVAHLNANVSERNLELVNAKNAERRAADQVRKLENQLGLETRAKKRLEDKLKLTAKEINTEEKQRVIGNQLVKKFEEKESTLKKRIRVLETQLRLLLLRSPVEDKEGK
jgi:PPM family protein phosphatase